MEHIDAQQPVREKLIEIMGRRALSFETMASEIGVATGTVFYFMMRNRFIRIPTLYKINKYIKNNEE